MMSVPNDRFLSPNQNKRQRFFFRMKCCHHRFWPICALPTRGSKLITLPTCTSIRYLPPPPVPTSPSDVRKIHFYSKLEHNTDRTTRTYSLFLTSPRNAKIPVIELGFWFFWSCFHVKVRFWFWVVLRHWIFEDRSSLGTTFLLHGSKPGFQVLMVAFIHKKLIIDVFFKWKLLRFKWAYMYIWD